MLDTKNIMSPTGRLRFSRITPSYHVGMSFLEPLLQLEPSPACAVMWIVIVDNPNAAGVSALQYRHGHRADVHIRINGTTVGAPASRNRGLDESAGEWAHFLDDAVSYFLPKIFLCVCKPKNRFVGTQTPLALLAMVRLHFTKPRASSQARSISLSIFLEHRLQDERGHSLGRHR